jgi:hypothetical protein
VNEALAVLKKVSSDPLVLIVKSAFAKNDKIIALQDVLIAQAKAHIDDKDEKIHDYMRRPSQYSTKYRLVFEWRSTLDWYLRVIFPRSSKTSPGAVWKKLVNKDFARWNASIVDKVFVDKVFTALRPHFPLRYQSVERTRHEFINVYGDANAVIHTFPTIADEKGLCCGGIDLEK